MLIPFPFTDLRSRKVRPAVVLALSAEQDVIVSFITSHLPTAPEPTAHALLQTDPEFAATGLKIASLVRLDKIATLERSLVLRRIGRVGPQTELAISSALRYVFAL